MAKLTAKQATFVQEYLIDMNASQAGVRAGFKHPDIGRQLLTKPHVVTAIAAAQAERSERTGITADLVLKNIVRLGNKAEDEGRYSEALKAQEMLAKHVGLFTNSVDVNIRTPPQLIVQFSDKPQLLTEG